MTHRRQNFMGGAAILAGAVAVTKLLGALYKIPLGNLLDREGMAHFYAAYNIYSLLLVLSTAGLPLALSRLVSRAAAQGRLNAQRRIFRTALALLAVIGAVALVCIGVIALGITESNEDEELRRARQDESNRHYAKSWLAIALPVIYCLLDALGTFADSRVLEKLGEELADACNVAYELTFLVMGIACAIYVLGIKKQRLIPKQEGPKYLGAVCETIGQFFYIYALADTEHVAFAAPIISSYCVASVIWGRIFLKEKLSKKHYACIALVVAGIVIMGILDI